MGTPELIGITLLAYLLALLLLVGDIPMGLIDRKTLMYASFLSIIPAAFTFIVLASL